MKLQINPYPRILSRVVRAPKSALTPPAGHLSEVLLKEEENAGCLITACKMAAMIAALALITLDILVLDDTEKVESLKKRPNVEQNSSDKFPSHLAEYSVRSRRNSAKEKERSGEKLSDKKEANTTHGGWVSWKFSKKM